jgi:hypothetical protein
MSRAGAKTSEAKATEAMPLLRSCVTRRAPAYSARTRPRPSVAWLGQLAGAGEVAGQLLLVGGDAAWTRRYRLGEDLRGLGHDSEGTRVLLEAKGWQRDPRR